MKLQKQLLFPLRFLPLFLVLFSMRANAHTLADEVVWVDTDGAADDYRAILLLVDLPSVYTAGIVTGDGSADRKSTAIAMRVFLEKAGHGDIPVFVGAPAQLTPPSFRPAYDALGAMASREARKADAGDWKTEFYHALDHVKGGITYVALGSLGNLASALASNPRITRRISRVLWFGDPKQTGESFNRDLDPAALDAVLKSGLPLTSFQSPGSSLIFSENLYTELTRDDTPKSEALKWLHSVPDLRERLVAGHFRIWDELPIIYLVRSELFEEKDGVQLPDESRIIQKYIHLFRGPAGIPPSNDTVAFEQFPLKPELFRTDIAEVILRLVERHGPDETRGAVLVSELHQHLGLYSIIGVKMSIRARELLEEPNRPLHVVSKAGLEPPFSCLNDGLQVGAGATMGLGLLRVLENGPKMAEATFSIDDKIVTLRLKPDVMKQMREDISSLKARHNGFTSDYYQDLRKNAVHFWLTLNRDAIFETVEENGSSADSSDASVRILCFVGFSLLLVLLIVWRILHNRRKPRASDLKDSR